MKTNPENSLESLKEVLPVLEGVEDWTEENIHDALFDLIGKLGVKMTNLCLESQFQVRRSLRAAVLRYHISSARKILLQE